MNNDLTDEDVQRTTEAAHERLRGYSDEALAQIVIAETATEVADIAASLACDRDGRHPDETVDAAAVLAAHTQRLLESTVLAARLAGRSWEAIGEAITGQSGKRQTMINRYGHLEDAWREGLLEPVEPVRDGAGRLHATRSRLPEALSWDIARQVQRLQTWIDTHHPGRTLGLPETTPTSRVADYLWRLNTATDRYGVTGIPEALAADIDTRKAEAVAAQQASHDQDGTR